MRINLRELPGARTLPVSHPQGQAGPSRTAYLPSLSADGRVVAFAVSDARGNALWAGGKRVAGEVFEPRITGDGRAVVFTDPGGRVLLRDVAGGTDAARQPGPAGPRTPRRRSPPRRPTGGTSPSSAAPRTSARPGAGSASSSATVERGTTEVVSGGKAFAFDPAISSDGRFVVYAEPSAIRLYDRLTASTTTVAAVDGYASEPAVSADGRRVVFTSTAAHGGKPEGIAGVFLADLGPGTTRLLSRTTRSPARRAPSPGRRGPSSARSPAGTRFAR